MSKFASCLEPFDTSVLEDMERLLQARLDRARLDNDYPFFAGQILRIRTKNGAIAPLVFNRAQEHIHDELEAQLANLGRVRALILKGRQQGCSTYIGGRYYHRASRNKGLRVYILTRASGDPEPVRSGRALPSELSGCGAPL